MQIASDGHDINRACSAPPPPAPLLLYAGQRSVTDMYELRYRDRAGVFYTGTCRDAIDAAAQCLGAGVDQDLGGMSYGPRCDPRNTTIYGCGSAVTEGGTCPHCRPEVTGRR